MRLWARWSALRDWRVRRVHSDRQTLIRQGCECRFRPSHDSLLSFPLSVNLLRVRSVEMGPNDSTMTSTSNVNWLMSLNRPPEVSASRYETMAGSGRPGPAWRRRDLNCTRSHLTHDAWHLTTVLTWLQLKSLASVRIVAGHVTNLAHARYYSIILGTRHSTEENRCWAPLLPDSQDRLTFFTGRTECRPVFSLRNRKFKWDSLKFISSSRWWTRTFNSKW